MKLKTSLTLLTVVLLASGAVWLVAQSGLFHSLQFQRVESPPAWVLTGKRLETKFGDREVREFIRMLTTQKEQEGWPGTFAIYYPAASTDSDVLVQFVAVASEQPLPAGHGLDTLTLQWPRALQVTVEKSAFLMPDPGSVLSEAQDWAEAHGETLQNESLELYIAEDELHVLFPLEP